jgi:hypothetical protein
MDEAKIIEGIQPGGTGGRAGSGNPVTSDNVDRPSKEVKPLPSGKAKKDDM